MVLEYILIKNYIQSVESSLVEIQYLPENNSNSEDYISILNSYITNIFLKKKKSLLDKKILLKIKELDYSKTFNYERRRYNKKYSRIKNIRT